MSTATIAARNKYFASLLSDAAKSFYERGTAYSPNDERILECYRMDLVALNKIVAMISKSNETQSDYQAIRSAIWSLDTVVRDVIPNEIYTHFMSRK